MNNFHEVIIYNGVRLYGNNCFEIIHAPVSNPSSMFLTFLDLTPLEFPKAVHCGSNMPPTNPYADTLFLQDLVMGPLGGKLFLRGWLFFHRKKRKTAGSFFALCHAKLQEDNHLWTWGGSALRVPQCWQPLRFQTLELRKSPLPSLWYSGCWPKWLRYS